MLSSELPNTRVQGFGFSASRLARTLPGLGLGQPFNRLESSILLASGLQRLYLERLATTDTDHPPL